MVISFLEPMLLKVLIIGMLGRLRLDSEKYGVVDSGRIAHVVVGSEHS